MVLHSHVMLSKNRFLKGWALVFFLFKGFCREHVLVVLLIVTLAKLCLHLIFRLLSRSISAVAFFVNTPCPARHH